MDKKILIICVIISTMLILYGCQPNLEIKKYVIERLEISDIDTKGSGNFYYFDIYVGLFGYDDNWTRTQIPTPVTCVVYLFGNITRDYREVVNQVMIGRSGFNAGLNNDKWLIGRGDLWINRREQDYTLKICCNPSWNSRSPQRWIDCPDCDNQGYTAADLLDANQSGYIKCIEQFLPASKE